MMQCLISQNPLNRITYLIAVLHKQFSRDFLARTHLSLIIGLYNNLTGAVSLAPHPNTFHFSIINRYLFLLPKTKVPIAIWLRLSFPSSGHWHKFITAPHYGCPFISRYKQWHIHFFKTTDVDFHIVAPVHKHFPCTLLLGEYFIGAVADA